MTAEEDCEFAAGVRFEVLSFQNSCNPLIPMGADGHSTGRNVVY